MAGESAADLAEADALLAIHDGKAAPALQMMTQQFSVLQSRVQLLLTLCTLTLTITGFSGPRIAASGPGARWALVIGIALVLLGLVLLLLSSLMVRFATQYLAAAGEPRLALAHLIAYRNRKTLWYRWQLGCIVLGLSGYVAAVIHFLLAGDKLISG
jgi:hypothetical protein